MTTTSAFFVCVRCGNRAETDGDCPRCPDSPLLDIRRDDARELIRENYSRRKGSREQWLLWLAVVLSIVLVVAANLIPAYQRIRRGMALPLFGDQIIIMAAIGWGVHIVLVHLLPPKRLFPEVGD